MEIIVSETYRPEENLATEKTILTERRGDVLFFYINDPCVVVGRNQLPEAEADTEFCRTHRIPVLRRLSGGGTVYQDRGNICYSFISDKTAVSLLDADYPAFMIEALSSFGIRATAGPRRDLWVEGKKISGTAAHLTRGRTLFHGTLLYDADLTMLEKTLRGNASLRGRKVASVPSPVRNLSELMTEKYTPEEFMRRLAEFFRRKFR